MGKYFGTDGFRGEANVDLTAEHAFRIGRFLGWKAEEDLADMCRDSWRWQSMNPNGYDA